MKAVIVDDEYYALQGLKMELEDIGGIEVSGMYEDGAAMLNEINKIRPDVIFLDVEMPQMNGFELYAQLLDTGFAANLIFVTAYNQYAVKAFEVNAIDYIVKPVTKSRLLKTLERVKPVCPPEVGASLQFNCFRNFSIISGGKDVNSGWRTRKAEELLAFLISEKGAYVSKEKIAEALWPEHERGTAMSNLYMAFHYIKKQEQRTGCRIPIESERGKMRINSELFQCDMLEFDRLFEEARRASGGEKAALMEKAVELYKGPPFEDGYFNWSNLIQGSYEYRYLNLLEKLLEYYTGIGDTQKASFYAKKLEIMEDSRSPF